MAAPHFAPLGDPGPYGYTIVRDGNSIVLRDGGAQPVARWQISSLYLIDELPFKLDKVFGPPVLRPDRDAPVEMLGRFAMPLQYYGGKPNPWLRSSNNGWLQLGPRRYTITHHVFRRTELHRDGRLIASGRGQGWVRKPYALQLNPQDELDQLAIGLLWFYVDLGRVGVFGNLLHKINIDPF